MTLVLLFIAITLLIDIYKIIYFTIIFPPLFILQNEIYYKTINYVIFDTLEMIRSAVPAHSLISLESRRVCSAVSAQLSSVSPIYYVPTAVHYEPTETPVRLNKDCASKRQFFEQSKFFLLLVTPPQMH